MARRVTRSSYGSRGASERARIRPATATDTNVGIGAARTLSRLLLFLLLFAGAADVGAADVAATAAMMGRDFGGIELGTESQGVLETLQHHLIILKTDRQLVVRW